MKQNRDFRLKACFAGALALALSATASPASSASFLSHLPFGHHERPSAGNVVKVQSGDAAFRVGQLEEQVRSLNGRIEELSFQLLQLEEKIRQMQEDNEFRFQQLEGGGGGAANIGGDRTEATPPVTEAPTRQQADNGLPGVEDTTTASTNPTQGTGSPPRTLGTITFDENGNVTGNGGTDLPNGSETAALDNPNDLYQAGYNHMLAGDYQIAEQVFRDFVDIYPGDDRASDAMFWLGEAQYSQGRYNDAAQTFLDAHNRFPKAEKGAETMLKLGMALAALDKAQPACATYRQLLSNYPGASQAVRSKAEQEQQRARC